MKYKGLNLFKIKDAVIDAKEIINLEASGKQLGLYSRFSKLNMAMLKYFRFGKFTLIAGRSGSGKSLLLNMLRNDFVSSLITIGNIDTFNGDLGKIQEEKENGSMYYPESRITKFTNGDLVLLPINANCVYDIICLHFGYEMAATDELIRTVGTILGKSYANLMSAEYSKERYNGYNKLNSEERKQVESILDSIGKRKEYYVPISGNINEMLATVDAVANNNPNAKIVVTLDHALLTRKENESGTEEIVSNLAYFAYSIKTTYNAMVIYLHQLNNEIEKHERLSNKSSHYPTKSDIHFGSQLWWAADDVMVIHVPAKLRIKEYGIESLDTEHLAHLILLKSRFSFIGNIWIREEFNKGRLHQTSIETFKKRSGFANGKRGSLLT